MHRRLRVLLVTVPTVTVLACGSDTAEIPPDRSAENAIPPVEGVPLDGVFVSATKGDDFTGNGSAGAPLKTLGAAILLADKQQVRVIACAEEYKEALTVRDGISMYGNVDCNVSPWKRVETLRAAVRSPSIPALTATSIARTTRIEGFHFIAPDALPTPSGSGATSIGGEIRDAKQLTIAFTTVQAGNGSGGADGVEPPVDAQGATGEGTGGPAFGQAFCANQFTVACSQVKKNGGGAGGTRTCVAGGNPGPGGKGGDGRVYDNAVPVTDPAVFGGDGLIEAGDATFATAATARGGTTAGERGQDGLPGTDGKSGQNGNWTFTAAGFVPGNGTTGEIGKPGQGGGGGAGREEWCINGVNPCTVANPSQPFERPYWFASSGAGGGSGGCAGVPGTAGFGGGASIGLLSTKSVVTLVSVELVGGKGGRAGKGALGLVGQGGAVGGIPSSTTSGAGKGGRGGHAGLSGHGAPGPSIALVYSEPAPVREGGTLLPGEPGERQPEILREGQRQSASESRALTEYPIVE